MAKILDALLAYDEDQDDGQLEPLVDWVGLDSVDFLFTLLEEKQSLLFEFRQRAGRSLAEDAIHAAREQQAFSNSGPGHHVRFVSDAARRQERVERKRLRKACIKGKVNRL